jgi:nitroreductase
MEFSAALKSRQSIRAFSDKAVSQELIDESLCAAIESPSSSRTQPYKITVASGETYKLQA